MEHWMETCPATEQIRAGKGSGLVDLFLRPGSEAEVRQALNVAGDLRAIKAQRAAEEGEHREDGMAASSEGSGTEAE